MSGRVSYNWMTAAVGMLVYPAFKPQGAGKVTNVTYDKDGFPDRVTVRTLKGVETRSAHHYNDFLDLVESHERKAKNQRAVADKLLAMNPIV